MSRFIPSGISPEVPLFPPPAPVAVLVDGRPLPAYVRAYVTGGRVWVPAKPLLSRVADGFWLEGGALFVARGGRVVRARLAPRAPEDLAVAYVAAGPLLRALGDSVQYRPEDGRLEVRTPPASPVATPTPYAPGAPLVPPSAVFTPQPVPTPKPVWDGVALPRRTPLPLSSPSSKIRSRLCREPN